MPWRTYAGIIAGVTDNSETGAGAVINNCTVSGTIYNKSVDWSQNGGITAYCYNSMILNCGAQVDITSISTGGTALAGGIVGQDGFAIVANNYARGASMPRPVSTPPPSAASPACRPVWPATTTPT